VTLDNSTGSHTNVDAADMTVGITGLAVEPTGSDLAAFLEARIDANSTWSTYVTCSTAAAAGRDSGSEQSRLLFANVMKGQWVESSPTFKLDGPIASTNKETEPLITTFSGGSAQSCYSAGDKVQNLLGSVANNTIFGGMGSMLSMGGGHGIPIGGKKGIDVLDATSDPSYVSDYIVGLQLPYNSFTGVTAGDIAVSTPQSYNARNLLYVTGFNAKSKDAAGNTLPAGDTLFDPRSKFTGIRGTVSGLEFDYKAGETIYSASITFQPLDMIVGF